MVMKTSAPGMFLSLIVAGLLGVVAQPTATQDDRTANPLTVHEWGTFTTIAGEGGQAVEWLPLGGPVDLPCFVHYYRHPFIKIAPGQITEDYQRARTTLRGTVRMETPVLYFYAARPTTVDVAVKFQQGLFTEWYPFAGVRPIAAYPKLTTAAPDAFSSITWNRVSLLPRDPIVRTDASPSHYYAARETDAVAIRANGEDEKFLFYRGVAGFPSPIAARLTDRGTVVVRNQSGFDVPAVILFAKQGARLSYRVHGALAARAEAAIDPPTAVDSTDQADMFASLRETLESTLVSQGLYAKEAAAMVETWRDSWFEDGTRLFYIVPPTTVDAILPLQIAPRPDAVARVFVGRMDVITPDQIRDVQTAVTTDTPESRRTLDRYGRLLGPIADRLLARTMSEHDKGQLVARLNGALAAYTKRLGRCGAPASTPETTAGGAGPAASAVH